MTLTTRDLFNLVDEIAAKGAAVEFVKERIAVDKNGSSPLEALMLGVMASFAEFERSLIRERQAEGIALAKAKGKYAQAPKLTAEDVAQAQAMVELGMPKTQIAATFKVSRQTLYAALRKARFASESTGLTD
ncbi:recombinase family protein (plasmid) [Citricoccus sp. SGAir0253]|nr:recombinase family protein [Citricoccus sp. SGAir0253]